MSGAWSNRLKTGIRYLKEIEQNIPSGAVTDHSQIGRRGGRCR
jgi:hypothetical protein